MTGIHVGFAPLTGDPADDVDAISAGTGQKLTVEDLGGVSPLSLFEVMPQVSVSTTATLTANRYTKADATSAPFTATLPSGGGLIYGAVVAVEKIDATANAVTVSGTIRGVSASLTLILSHETLLFFYEGTGSWRPLASHKTLSSLDARYALPTVANVFTATQTVQAQIVQQTAASQGSKNMLAIAGTGGLSAAYGGQIIVYAANATQDSQNRAWYVGAIDTANTVPWRDNAILGKLTTGAAFDFMYATYSPVGLGVNLTPPPSNSWALSTSGSGSSATQGGLGIRVVQASGYHKQIIQANPNDNGASAPSAGTFTITVNGFTTAGIAWNATASAVATAINTAVGSSVASGTGGPLPGSPVVILFSPNQPTMTVDNTSLTGSLFVYAGNAPFGLINSATGRNVLWIDTNYRLRTDNSVLNAGLPIEAPPDGTLRPIQSWYDGAAQGSVYTFRYNGTKLEFLNLTGSQTHFTFDGSGDGAGAMRIVSAKVGFFNHTPISQPARVGQLTDSSTGTSGGATVAAVTDVASAANAIATLAAKVNALELLPHNIGLTA